MATHGHGEPPEASPQKLARNVFLISFVSAILTIAVVIYFVLLGGGAQIIEAIIPAGSSFARDIDFVIVLIAVLVGFWFFAALFTFFWLIWRFRYRPENPRAEYLATHEHMLHRWVSWPHFLVIACDIVIIAVAVRTWVNVKQTLPPAESTVRIIGQQWAWTFQHPGPDNKLDTADDIKLVDELHLKENTLYHFQLTANDVLHSFSVPLFRLKQDAVPGRIITGWFKPTRAGSWDIQCAEMCGIGHGLMRAQLFVETAAQHEAFLASHTQLSSNARPQLASAGQQR